MSAADEARTAGRALRQGVPRGAHASIGSCARDPVAVLEGLSSGWLAELVALRYERMLVSPLAFFRGAAAIMATDLHDTPNSGLTVQAAAK